MRSLFLLGAAKKSPDGAFCQLFTFPFRHAFMRPSAPRFCQDFSTNFPTPLDFDRKFRGEIFKISPLKLPILSPKFAVKLQPICKLLIFSSLQNYRKIGDFVKIFYQFFPSPLSTATPHKSMFHRGFFQPRTDTEKA